MKSNKPTGLLQTWWFRGAAVAIVAVVCLTALPGILILRRAQRVTEEPDRATVEPDFFDRELACANIAEVQVSGFYNTEEKNKVRHRWTNGSGKLIVPVGKLKPKALTVILGLDAPGAARLAIQVNGKALFDDKVRAQSRWIRIFDLPEMPAEEEITIEVVSDTFIPAKVQPGNKDDRPLGVRVYGMTLHRDKPEFLNVLLGNQFVPGIEESGLYDPEKEGGTFVRWTKGNARFTVPIGKTRPRTLAVLLDVPRNMKDRLEIVVNGQPVFHEIVKPQNNWARKLSLDGVDVQGQLRIELRSGIWVPAQVAAQALVVSSTRALGLLGAPHGRGPLLAACVLVPKGAIPRPVTDRRPLGLKLRQVMVLDQ